ncbi:MAG: hypothetical protein CL728_04755 [Chloroflexi bacterium]|nr:hypothetical protein [Chloroflexota bacterium]|tara:strand:+ start:157 stop:633 length:477 start_codon:yes stop_codon:yes gene_type:complete
MPHISKLQTQSKQKCIKRGTGKNVIKQIDKQYPHRNSLKFLALYELTEKQKNSLKQYVGLIPQDYNTFKALHSVHPNKNKWIEIGEKITVGNNENFTTGFVIGAYMNKNGDSKVLLSNTSSCGYNGANRQFYSGKNSKNEIVEVYGNEIYWQAMGYNN